ncbi:CerR family C-terminal domain-containing protein [Chelatococcus reniformis]|uniref:Transcriptional regulator n=1 Tax=Chelatococcus reniformis TaxID=1494448 RepID=A0A916X783_9HYPH|nr:CerR family C-terminal domain-containing protein [Chelatococcus reniformis]GGC50058.1 transcriptional regulator [Chelatococcus reniformis]
MARKSSRPEPADAAAERGEATRQKLLLAATDVFGRVGFDGATTRALADAAGVNLQAIPYYFGGKEGLYVATAEHIAAQIGAHAGQARGRALARIAAAESGGPPLGRDEARVLLTDILQTMAALFVSPQAEAWARFLIREQMAPTEAFARVYGGLMEPMLRLTGRLVGRLLDEEPSSEHVRLRTLSLLGSVMVFRMAHAAALRQLAWTDVGPREIGALRDLAADLVAALVPRTEGGS